MSDGMVVSYIRSPRFAHEAFALCLCVCVSVSRTGLYEHMDHRHFCSGIDIRSSGGIASTPGCHFLSLFISQHTPTHNEHVMRVAARTHVRALRKILHASFSDDAAENKGDIHGLPDHEYLRIRRHQHDEPTLEEATMPEPSKISDGEATS